jgi:hypothetical protein
MKRVLISALIILQIYGNANARCVVCVLDTKSGASACVVAWDLNCSNGPCPSGETISVGHYKFGCENFRITSSTPIIEYELNGPAVLIDGSIKTKFASDELESKIKIMKNKDIRNFGNLIKIDKGIIDIKKLEKIAKEIGAKLIKVKKISTANNCLDCNKKLKLETKKTKELVILKSSLPSYPTNTSKIDFKRQNNSTENRRLTYTVKLVEMKKKEDLASIQVFRDTVRITPLAQICSLTKVWKGI